MGNNPVSNVDPTGGVTGPFASAFMNHALWTVGGAVLGGVIGGINGGWDGARQGAMIGGGIGLGASFVNWNAVGGFWAYHGKDVLR